MQNSLLGVSRRNSAQLSHRLGNGVPLPHCPVCQTGGRCCMSSSVAVPGAVINPADFITLFSGTGSPLV